ncbi:hypothetical protein BHM03_00022900 [Ensete ventricosum]|nr:hypothetical protein BHM03_00022900 [Ensete ventricosum]
MAIVVACNRCDSTVAAMASTGCSLRHWTLKAGGVTRQCVCAQSHHDDYGDCQAATTVVLLLVMVSATTVACSGCNSTAAYAAVTIITMCDIYNSIDVAYSSCSNAAMVASIGYDQHHWTLKANEVAGRRVCA